VNKKCQKNYLGEELSSEKHNKHVFCTQAKEDVLLKQRPATECTTGYESKTLRNAKEVDDQRQ
jgi:hypothetical protein